MESACRVPSWKGRWVAHTTPSRNTSRPTQQPITCYAIRSDQGPAREPVHATGFFMPTQIDPANELEGTCEKSSALLAPGAVRWASL